MILAPMTETEIARLVTLAVHERRGWDLRFHSDGRLMLLASRRSQLHPVLLAAAFHAADGMRQYLEGFTAGDLLVRRRQAHAVLARRDGATDAVLVSALRLQSAAKRHRRSCAVVQFPQPRDHAAPDTDAAEDQEDCSFSDLCDALLPEIMRHAAADAEIRRDGNVLHAHLPSIAYYRALCAGARPQDLTPAGRERAARRAAEGQGSGPPSAA